MKTLVSQEFVAKVPLLEHQSKNTILNLIRVFELHTWEQILEGKANIKVHPIEESLYMAASEQVRLIFSLGFNHSEPYILLLDCIVKQFSHSLSSNKFAIKNPNVDSIYNPKYNTSINPKYNTSINPKYNTSINPKYNTSINPKYNTSINPKYNTSINPKYNTSINPKYNTSINPKYNTSINPNYNSSFGGPFLYNVGLIQEGYIVRVDNLVSLIFDMSSKFIGYSVLVNDQCSVIYNESSEWTEYFISTNQEVLLRFDLATQWIGIVI